MGKAISKDLFTKQNAQKFRDTTIVHVNRHTISLLLFCHKTTAGLPIERQSRRRFLWYEKFLNQAEIFYKISKTDCIPSIFSKLSLMSLTSSRS